MVLRDKTSTKQSLLQLKHHGIPSIHAITALSCNPWRQEACDSPLQLARCAGETHHTFTHGCHRATIKQCPSAVTLTLLFKAPRLIASLSICSKIPCNTQQCKLSIFKQSSEQKCSRSDQRNLLHQAAQPILARERQNRPKTVQKPQ